MSYVYLLHFDPPYKHAGHYLGFTQRTPLERLEEHTKCGCKSSPLVTAAIKAGSKVRLVRLWLGTRKLERRLKGHSSTRNCPVCRAQAKAEGRVLA